MKQEAHYLQHLRYSTQERLAGLFVLSALAIITVLLLLSSQNMKLLQGRVEFIALMHKPVGVSTDTRVHISGIEAGSVKRIALMPDNRFRIVLSIYKEYKSLVRSDSQASISKLALIGDSVIDISPGSPEQPLLADGGVIEVREALSLDEMLASLRPMLDAVHSAVEDTAAVMAQLRHGGGTAGAMLYDEQIKNELASSIRLLQETLGITAEVARDSRGMMIQLKETAGILHQQMRTVPEMAMQTRDLIDETRKTVDAIGNTWPISANMPAEETEGPEVMASND